MNRRRFLSWMLVPFIPALPISLPSMPKSRIDVLYEFFHNLRGRTSSWRFKDSIRAENTHLFAEGKVLWVSGGRPASYSSRLDSVSGNEIVSIRRTWKDGELV